jgi:glycosyltransferase involved in cell wall biosynthesis
MAHFCAIRPVLLLETGLHSVPGAARLCDSSRPLRILWCGDLEPHKALHLLLQALAGIGLDVQYDLRIIGSGRLLDSLRRLAERLNISEWCSWMGRLSHQDTLRHYEWADLLVFTSLRDTSGNVMLEAFSYGVPVVCFDHQGAADIVSAESGIKMAVSTPGEAVRQLRTTIETLARDRQKLSLLSKGALKRARDFLWERNGELMAAAYRAALGIAKQGSEIVASPEC